MQKLKELSIKLGKALLFPHVAIISVLIPLSIALLIYSFLFSDKASIGSIVSYVISAYTLTVVCSRIPNIIETLKNIKNNNKYVLRFFEDRQLRINLSLYFSLIINTGFAIFQFGLGFYHKTLWYHTLAIYYILLVVMRFFLVRYTRSHTGGEDAVSEYKIYRLCGILLAVMNLVLGTIVFYISKRGMTFRHHEITTIAIAAFTFTSLTLAIINSVKYKKLNSPAFSASKAVSLASALVSMLTLEAAMLNAFGTEESAVFSEIMTTATGAVVALAVLVIAVYMIIKSTLELKSLKSKIIGDKDVGQ